ncbi:unnamed protein product [Amoebophrya sp. A25]|nr:unnamed protein product [Amoebophrya sp. A25]|eukprot:GSA25T00000545001.1
MPDARTTGTSRALLISDIPAMCWRCSAPTYTPNLRKPALGAIAKTLQNNTSTLTSGEIAADENSLIANVALEEKRRFRSNSQAALHVLKNELRPDGYFVIFMSSIVVALVICREIPDVLLCEIALDRAQERELFPTASQREALQMEGALASDSHRPRAPGGAGRSSDPRTLSGDSRSLLPSAAIRGGYASHFHCP